MTDHNQPPVSAEQVAMCQVALKMARLFEKPNHTDSWVDIIGYAALGGDISHRPGRHIQGPTRGPTIDYLAIDEPYRLTDRQKDDQ